MNENACGVTVTATVMDSTWGGELDSITKCSHTREKGIEWAIDWIIQKIASRKCFKDTITEWEEDLKDYGIATWEEYVKKSLLEDEGIEETCYIKVEPIEWID